MATITPLKTIPHTRIENYIIKKHLKEIGAYGLTIYTVIKYHKNHKTSQCNPSYNTIADMIGIDRTTVIRYVKILKALGLLSPTLQFTQEGIPTSNQYNFPSPAYEPDQQAQQGGGGTEPLPVVAEGNYPGGTEPPEQILENKHKYRTSEEIIFYLNDKQKTCPHPQTEVSYLSDVIICHRCYYLLEENQPIERVA